MPAMLNRCSLRVSAVTAVAMGLGADYLWNEYVPVIEWRVKQCLRQGTPLQNTSRLIKTPPLIVEPRVDMPVLLIGPTGSGKTTMLYQFASGRPKTLLIALSPVSDKSANRSSEDKYELYYSDRAMHHVTKSICEQVGYPTEQSVISAMLRWAFNLPDPPAPRRLMDALGVLFKVAEEFYREPNSDGKHNFEKCVLLFDNFELLMRNSLLRHAGGDMVFKYFGGLLDDYCMKIGSVSAAVTGSSGQLTMDFDNTGTKFAFWCFERDVSDPPEDLMRSALEAARYSSKDAQRSVDVLGTRLRLLSEFLGASDPSKKNVDAFINETLEYAEYHLRELFSGLSPEEKRLTAQQLDDICSGKEVQIHDVVDKVNSNPAFSRALFLTSGYCVAFQSRPVERVWSDPSRRAEILK